MTVPVQTLRITQTRKLGNRVRMIRWILVIGMFIVAAAFEISEHVIDAGVLDFNFSFEVIFFGIIGPAISFFVLTWISYNLFQLAEAHETILEINSTLEKRIESRTAELSQANTRLQQLDQLKSEFVSLVSHELRTPLTSIQGGLELILQEPTTDDDETQKMLRIVQKEVTRLSNLVRQILDVSAIEAGGLQIKPGPVALRPLISDVVQRCRLLGGQHQFQLDIPAQIPLIWADEARLVDVLVNLLNNAIKYSPKDSHIQIKAQVEVSNIHVMIKDEGMGILAEDQANLFQLFYRGNRPETAETPGYGLGLYFCNKLLEAQNSKIWAESAGIVGNGSIFHLLLPLETSRRKIA